VRILADIPSNRILQVAKNPALGEPVAHNGRYSVPVPEGVSVKVTPSSVVLPNNSPDSVILQSYTGLLMQLPQFEQVLYNPLIEPTHMDDLDPTGILREGSPPVEFGSRNQIGRGTAGPLPAGMAPNSVALLSENTTVTPSRPGVLVTNTIDLAPFTGGAGASDFAVYWYLYDFETTIDVRASVGTFANQNLPSLRRIVEVPQEPSDFQAFISVNDGVTYFPVSRKIPISFCSASTQIRLAFKNTSPTARRYLAAYALLF